MSRKLMKTELDFVFELAEGMCGAYGEDCADMRERLAEIRTQLEAELEDLTNHRYTVTKIQNYILNGIVKKTEAKKPETALVSGNTLPDTTKTYDFGISATKPTEPPDAAS